MGDAITADNPIAEVQQRADLVRRARNVFGSQLAEAIITQNPEPDTFIGLSKRANTLSMRDLTSLRDALEVAAVLCPTIGSPTIQAWFIGFNPDLDDRVPAEVIVYEPEAVLAAARRFVANG